MVETRFLSKRCLLHDCIMLYLDDCINNCNSTYVNGVRCAHHPPSMEVFDQWKLWSFRNRHAGAMENTRDVIGTVDG